MPHPQRNRPSPTSKPSSPSVVPAALTADSAGRPDRGTRVESWRSADPAAVRCHTYSEHRAAHRRYEGRWRCMTCFPVVFGGVAE
jgi:hypothetical protein